jgi:very-short-patch-repair endonuclease
VTTPRRGPADQPAIAVHRAKLDGADVNTISGIPVTTLAHTLVDLAAVIPGDQLAKAITEAERRRSLDVAAIASALERTRTRRGPGHAAMRHALSELDAAGLQLTRSELEDRFRRLIAVRGLPVPRLNATVDGVEVDALWPPERVIVELDGYAYHHTRRAFERDRRKTNALTLAGFTVLRFTHDDVVRRPERVAGSVAHALGRR